MSQELASIRRGLTKVSTDIKKGLYISAATGVRDAARLVMRVPMLKNEHEEFTTLIQASCELLRYKKEIAKIFPLAISYTVGQESALVEILDELIATLQLDSTENALREHEERKQAALEKGRKELNDGEHDEARNTFTELTTEYDDDPDLAAEVGESFMQAGLYEDASKHLGNAAKLTPDSAHVFNRLGIALRKMKRFDKAEENFKMALALEPGDPNLHFNMGRLYLDKQDWENTVKSAESALTLNPDFEEASKLAAYARRQLTAGQ